MALIEHLHENGSSSERIALQHVIDFARQSDRELRKARTPQWWKDVISTGGTDEFPPVEDVILLEPLYPDVADKAGESSTILDDFSQTQEYQGLQEQLATYLENPLSEQKKRKIFQEFSGAAFENLAYMYLADTYGDDNTVLSPEETDLFFLERYPDRDVREFPFGKIGLEKVKVPDSLVMQGDRVVFQAEFSLHGKEDYYHHKFEGYLSNRYAKRFGGQYDHAQLVFGVPSSYSPTLEDRLTQCYGEDITFLKLPFTHHQFYQEVIDPTVSSFS